MNAHGNSLLFLSLSLSLPLSPVQSQLILETAPFNVQLDDSHLKRMVYQPPIAHHRCTLRTGRSQSQRYGIPFNINLDCITLKRITQSSLIAHQRCTLKTGRSEYAAHASCNAQRTMCTIHRTPYTLHRSPYTVHRAPHTAHRAP